MSKNFRQPIKPIVPEAPATAPDPAAEPAPKVFLTDTDQTPPDYARVLVDLADVEGKVCLEPSFGNGEIVKAMLGKGAILVTCVETDSDKVTELGATISKDYSEEHFNLYDADFLGLHLRDGDFDRVVMVPPFDDPFPHLLKAMRLLARGGVMVAVMDKRCLRAEEFMELIKFNSYRLEPVPSLYRVDGLAVEAVAIVLIRS